MSTAAGSTGGQWQSSLPQSSQHPPVMSAEEEGVTIKPMRLKVLYTFDDQNKTNCLARWAHVLQIRTVVMDETTTIGVIELKVCIQAIVQCSPELVAKLGQDYTVYAYDYSEYEQPLVGQGMLSWALSASSQAQESPASESQKLITGRVCKNIQGLFSNGVKDTLEVKLRLVPVPTVLQSEYLNSMEKYREVSRHMPPNLDHNEWLGFLRANPNIGQMTSNLHSGSIVSGRSHEVVNQLLSPSLSNLASDPFNNLVGNEAASEERRPVGRPPGGKNSRPSSRASVKRPRKARAKTAAGGNTSAYEEGTDGDDGPPSKKRAKVVQADWEGKSSFGAVSDSLLVAASTMNSIRTFRPIAIAPNSGASGSHLQEIPRAPTPVPGRRKTKSLQRSMSQNIMRRDSLASQGSEPRYQSPYSFEERTVVPQDSEVRMSIESALTSPEKNNDSCGETPPDVASSPPVLMRATSTRQSSPQAPSSPVLPQMPRNDSGFMSGNLDDIGDLFGDEEEPPFLRDPVAAAENHKRSDFESFVPNTAESQPQTQPYNHTTQPRRTTKSREGSRANSILSDDLTTLLSMPNPDTVSSASIQGIGQSHFDTERHPVAAQNQDQVPQQAESRPTTASLYHPPASRISRTASVGSLTMPMAPPSEPTLPPPSTLFRSQTCPDAGHPPSEATMVEKNKLRDAEAKKISIREKLEAAILNGDAPPFCQNCGAIETPTWRKCFVKAMNGDPGFIEYSDEPGRVIALEVLTKGDDGKPTSYKVYKKVLGDEDNKATFEEHLLCNPCGIWLSKFKSHRPEDRWYKDTKPRTRGPNSKPKKSRKNGQSALTSEANFQSDFFQSEAPGPVEQDQVGVTDGQTHVSLMAPAGSYQRDTTYQNAQPVNAPDHRPRQRASSMRPVVVAKTLMSTDFAESALRRAIQSSPARYLGSQHTPIDLEDDNLGNTRRLLFPSPRKDGSPKTLGELATNTILPIAHHSPTRSKAVLEIVSADKENLAPPFEDEDGLQKLIEQALSEGPQRPKTPTPKTSSKIVFKTPTRATPSHRPVTRSVSRSARSYRHEALPQRTPTKTPSSRRRSPRHPDGNEESPFTADLNRLISEVNNRETDSPSRHLNLNLEFSLPDLSHSANGNSDHLFSMPNFDQNHDFFSTDVPMPSSPPRMFSLYEDPLNINFSNENLSAITNMGDLDGDMWNDFQMDMQSGSGEGAGRELGGLLVDENGRATFDFAAATGMTVIKKEPVEEDRFGDDEGQKA